MWSLAHISFAFLLGLLINKKWKLDRLLFFCLLLAGDLPDIDGDLFHLLGYDGSALHGGVTHTILGVFIIALIIAPLIWAIESLWIRNTKSPAIKEEKQSWQFKRLQLFLLIAFIGGLIHLGVDVLNTSNEYARQHHLYLWPLSDYSFHLDLMLAGMPEDRMAAWSYRPLVKLIMAITNILLITGLWILHYRYDKHFWDVLYSENQYYLIETEPVSFLRKIQRFLDKNQSKLNVLVLIALSIAFSIRISDQLFQVLSLTA